MNRFVVVDEGNWMNEVIVAIQGNWMSRAVAMAEEFDEWGPCRTRGNLDE